MAPPPGSIGRAMLLVRLLACAGSRGLALTDLARATTLSHGTVHRILRKLIGERMVRQIKATRRYALGVLAFELGLAASAQFDIRPFCQPVLKRLADSVDDTVYLIGRSGSEAVCLDRFEGRAPIRVLEIEIGSRRPLGIGAGGLAILSALSDGEIADVFRQAGADPGFFPHRAEDVWTAVSDTRRRGHAVIHDRVTRGVSAVGVAISNLLGAPVASITVAGVHERMNTAHIKVVSAALREARRVIERLLVGAEVLEHSH
jgi:DNA-binding IclR family transcriptional regulator